jgi:hypothetical protein
VQKQIPHWLKRFLTFLNRKVFFMIWWRSGY